MVHYSNMSTSLSVDKSKTAIVVIDLQKGIAAMETQPYAAKTVIENAARLLDVFRKNSMPVFLVRVAMAPDSKDRLSPVSDITWGNAGRQMPADWNELVLELRSETSDFIITKKQWGAFYGTELDLQLRRRKIDTIVLCGISTNIGVESTARFAYEYGYNQIFVEDAMLAQSKEQHDNTVQNVFPRIGFVRSTKGVLDAVEKQ